MDELCDVPDYVPGQQVVIATVPEIMRQSLVALCLKSCIYDHFSVNSRMSTSLGSVVCGDGAAVEVGRDWTLKSLNLDTCSDNGLQ